MGISMNVWSWWYELMTCNVWKQTWYDIIHDACMNKTVVLGKSMKSYPEVWCFRLFFSDETRSPAEEVSSRIWTQPDTVSWLRKISFSSASSERSSLSDPAFAILLAPFKTTTRSETRKLPNMARNSCPGVAHWMDCRRRRAVLAPLAIDIPSRQ